MKKIKLEKIGPIVLLSLLLTIPSVLSIGIPTPFPSNLRLMRGDTAEFRMRIQAVQEPVDLSCTPYVEEFEPLGIAFKETTVIVESGKIRDVWGILTVPNNAEIKTYEGRVRATCEPITSGEEVSGSTITKSPGSRWSLSVVATAAERNVPTITTIPFTSPAPEVTPTVPTSTIITIIIIIAVLAIGVNYWLSKKGKKKK